MYIVLCVYKWYGRSHFFPSIRSFDNSCNNNNNIVPVMRNISSCALKELCINWCINHSVKGLYVLILHYLLLYEEEEDDFNYQISKTVYQYNFFRFYKNFQLEARIEIYFGVDL